MSPPGLSKPGHGRRGGHNLRAASLQARLRASFALAALVLAFVALVCSLSFVSLTGARHTLFGKVDPANLEADQLLVGYLNQETAVRGYVLSGEPAFLEPYELGLAQAKGVVGRLNRSLAGEPADLRLARQAEAQGAKWQAEYAKPAIADVRNHATRFASQADLLKSKSLFDAVRDRFAALDAALAASRASAAARLASATDTLIAALVAAVVLIVTTGIVMNRSLRAWVTAPLASVASDARAVADGDVAHRISPTGPPDFRRLAQDVEAMRERIVDELKQAESASAELAVLNGELSRSNTELEQFAYVASHDLQEPIRKVTSFVQLLEQRYRGQLDERADQYIEFAVDGAKRMQMLINDLLALSRVGRTTERFEHTDLGLSLRVALADLRALITETGAEVDVGALPVVNGDPSLLTSLWQNLVGNAIKFRSDEQPIIKIEGRASEGSWLCTVADNGIGVEPRFADRIFVLFQRLHSREAYSGTGIGLALCKKIVEFHGGSIWLDVDYHPGTRICFTLPFADAPVSEAEVSEAEVRRDHD